MKYELLNNDWPVIVHDDPVNITDDDYQELGRLLAEKTVLVWKRQTHLTIYDEVEMCAKFGEVRSYEWPNKAMWRAISPDNPKVANVTGKKNEENLPGLHAGKSDLDWHCNAPWLEDRRPIVYLWAKEHSRGSRTSYINTIHAYRDLSDEWKQRIKTLQLRPASTNDKYSEHGKNFGLVAKENLTYHPSVHQKNHAGLDTLYYPFNQVHGFFGIDNPEETEEIHQYLMNHMLQEKYIYHHDWEDGDIVIADQWSGLHKRWAFEGMDKRLLHRLNFDYKNIKF
jgi:alpha-ketoglutarate-dependent taurine dioxygenase